MKYSAALALAAGLASAAPAAQAPGGAIPAGINVPDTTGFINPVALPSRGGLAVCVSGTIPVRASTTKNLKFNFEVPQNQTVLTQTFVNFTTPGSPFMQDIMGGMQNVSGVYNISGSLCAPANSNNTTEVQFLTHGVGFDRYYWDFAPGYSYVDVAAQNGIATFLYDRLGVGASDKPDALNVVQGSLEAEIANQLAKQLRKGVFGSKAFKRVIGVGHSFGSLITESITSQYPSTFDAAVLTGFSMNQTGLPAFVSGLNFGIASAKQPYRFAELDPGYIVAGEASGNQIAFFHFPGFDPAIAAQADAQKGTTTYGELFTQSSLAMPAKNYTGPVAIVNGFEDLPFCFGNCTFPVNKAQAALTVLYPMAKNTSTTHFAPRAGHGLNLHYSAVDTYTWIQNWIKSNGF